MVTSVPEGNGPVEGLNLRILKLCLLAIACISSQQALAKGGIVTDGTVGPIHRFNEKNIDISEKYGTRRGGNLFHSFKEFNVNTGKTVTFTEDKPTENFISRVTGKSTSDVNGVINVESKGEANFYLINPNGILFGKGSSVNVPGSIHLSTADYLKLKDGKVYSAIKPQSTTSSLSSAAPAAFGFLGSSDKNNGLFKINSTKLSSEKSFDVVAGNIHIHKGFLDLFNDISNVELRLNSFKGVGEVSLDTNNYRHLNSAPKILNPILNGGDILVSESKILLSGFGTGKVGIWGGNVVLTKESILVLANISNINPNIDNGVFLTAASLSLNNDSQINSQANEFDEFSGQSANIKLNISGAINMNNESKIVTQSTDLSDAGNILIFAGQDIIIQNAARILSNIFFSALGNHNFPKSGDVTITAGNNIKLLSGGRIEKTTTALNGALGGVELKANNFLIDNAHSNADIKTGIFTDTQSSAHAGNIDIDLDGNFVMLNGGEISSSTTKGSGNSGNIQISANKIHINNALVKAESGTESSGRPGNIKFTETKDILINNGAASILSKSLKNNGAGSISIDFKNNLRLKSSTIITESNGGNGGGINFKGDNVVMETGFIQANSKGTSTSGGTINLNIANLVTSGNQLNIGGKTPLTNWNPDSFGFNVIQSAAPNGINGLIDNRAPVLNLSGTLASLGAPRFNSGELNWNDCFSSSTNSSIRLVKARFQPNNSNFWVY